MNNENLHIYADDANTSKDSIDVKRLKRIYRNVYKTPNERKSSKNLQILLTPLLFIDCLTWRYNLLIDLLDILINKTENVVNENEPTFVIEDPDYKYTDDTENYLVGDKTTLGNELGDDDQENRISTTTGFESNDQTVGTTLSRLKSKSSTIVIQEDDDPNEFNSEYSTLVSVDFKPRGSKILKDGIALNLKCMKPAVSRTIATGAVAPLRDVPELESDFPSPEASLLKIIDGDLNIMKNEGREKLEYRNSNVFSRLSNSRTSGTDFESIRRLIKLSNEDLFNMEYFLLSDMDFDLMRSTLKIVNNSAR